MSWPHLEMDLMERREKRKSGTMDNLMGTVRARRRHCDEMALALGSFTYDLRIGKGVIWTYTVEGMLHEIYRYFLSNKD